MTWQKSLRSRDLATIGHIANRILPVLGLDMETLSTEYHQVFFKTQDEVGFKRCLTFDLYLGQVKGHRKISYKKMFRAGMQVSWYEWILPFPYWDFTIRTFICPFFMSFSVIIPWQHDIFSHKWLYELVGPWPMCPPSFIEITCKMREISPLSNYTYNNN